MNIEVLESNKGGLKFAIDGFLYTKRKVLKSGRISWRCVRRTTFCPGTLTTSPEITDPQFGHDHNHDPNRHEVEAVKAKQALKRKAFDSNETTSAMINATRAATTGEARTLLGNDSSLGKIVRRVRAKHGPPLPDYVQDLIIDGKWEETSVLSTPRMADTKDSIVKEGKAEIFQPLSVFYNPVQEFNRDLTIAVISEFAKDHFTWVRENEEKKQKQKVISKEEENSDEASVLETTSSLDQMSELVPGESHPNGLRILEALAATGLRSIRFAKEIPGVKEIIANDYDKKAVEYIERNIVYNNVNNLVRGNQGDASMVLYQHRQRRDQFDVVDLDPYGSPARFLDAAVQAVRDGGLLCITCTDMGVLCGNGTETCFSKYGSLSLRSPFCHEAALRILLQSVESNANRYSRYTEPMLSISADFYVRVFLKVHTGQKTVKESVTKLSSVYLCGGCSSFYLLPLATKTPTSGGNFKFSPTVAPNDQGRCSECNSRLKIGGPLWSAPIHDFDFVARVIDSVESRNERLVTTDRIKGMLTVISEELSDVPLYYRSDELLSLIYCGTPKLAALRSALLHAGYRVSGSHAAQNALKTDAPTHVLYDIARCWAKLCSPNPEKIKANVVAKAVMDKTPTLEANFELHPLANPKSRADGLLRYQVNPDRNWGPKPRAKKSGAESLDSTQEKGMQRAKQRREAKRKDQEPIDYKAHACKRFKEGKCDLGEDCRYNHNVEPIETA